MGWKILTFKRHRVLRDSNICIIRVIEKEHAEIGGELILEGTKGENF